jgi:pimeloyl-ACP methyl ester carboxylesterase
MAEVSIARGEVTLRATVTGTGPTVLLLHAGGEQRGVWAPVAALLATSGLRTVAFDQRGHGESAGRATTLRELADDVTEMVGREPAPIVVVGASLGGLATIAALADPCTAGRVAGLVLVDVVPDPDPGRIRVWLDAQGLPGRGLLDRHGEVVDDILESGPELLAIAAALDLPILLVRAGRSPLADADAERLCAANRRVTVTRVPTAGHLVARDAPAELARIVAEHATTWLRTQSRPGTAGTGSSRSSPRRSTVRCWPFSPVSEQQVGEHADQRRHGHPAAEHQGRAGRQRLVERGGDEGQHPGQQRQGDDHQVAVPAEVDGAQHPDAHRGDHGEHHDPGASHDGRRDGVDQPGHRSQERQQS